MEREKETTGYEPWVVAKRQFAVQGSCFLKSTPLPDAIGRRFTFCSLAWDLQQHICVFLHHARSTRECDKKGTEEGAPPLRWRTWRIGGWRRPRRSRSSAPARSWCWRRGWLKKSSLARSAVLARSHPPFRRDAERIWHTLNSRGLGFRVKFLQFVKVFPLCSKAHR